MLGPPDRTAAHFCMNSARTDGRGGSFIARMVAKSRKEARACGEGMLAACLHRQNLRHGPGAHCGASDAQELRAPGMPTYIPGGKALCGRLPTSSRQMSLSMHAHVCWHQLAPLAPVSEASITYSSACPLRDKTPALCSKKTKLMVETTSGRMPRITLP